MPPAVKTAEAPRPLTDAERTQLADLLARDSAGQAPAVRVGKEYVALVNISVPRRGDPEHGADLVYAGEKVHLTDDEAALYLRHGSRDGRQVPVIRPSSGPESSQLQPQRIPPRAVSGRLQGPPADARPDPPGSSAIQVAEPARVPEAFEPQAGQENWDGDPGAGGHAVDAEDIIPSRVRARQAPRG